MSALGAISAESLEPEGLRVVALAAAVELSKENGYSDTDSVLASAKEFHNFLTGGAAA